MNYNELTHDQIIDEVDKLLDIDSDNLDAEAIRNQKIFGTIQRIYRQRASKLIGLMEQKDAVEMKRTRFYSGKLSAEEYKKEPLRESILKTDIPKYLDNDDLVKEIRKLVKEEEMVVKYLEEAKGSLRSRGFDIKNAIEWRKLMMGG